MKRAPKLGPPEPEPDRPAECCWDDDALPDEEPPENWRGHVLVCEPHPICNPPRPPVSAAMRSRLRRGKR